MRPAVLAALTVLLASSAAAAVEPKINVEDQSPSPAQPGDTFELEIVVANKGTTAGSFGPVTVETADGVEYTGTTSTVFKDEFRLCGGCQKVGTLNFRLEEDVASGTHPVRIRLPAEDISILQSYSVRVDGSAVLTAELSGAEVGQDERGEVEISVTNVGTDTAASTLVSFNTGRIVFEPSRLSMGELAPGETVTRAVKVTPDGGLPSGARNLNITAEYTEDGERTSSNLGGSLTVLENAELAFDRFSAEDPVVGKETDLATELENLGPGEAERIEVEASCTGAELKFSTSFVAQLDDGESIPASFPMEPTAEEVDCRVEAGYSDSERNTVSKEYSFTADRQSSRTPYLVAGAVVLLVVLGLLYRRRRDELEEV